MTVKRKSKDIAKLVLPGPVVRRIQRNLSLRTRPLDLSRVALIHDASKEELLDPAYLEDRLLPELGLNDEMVEEFPPPLHQYAGYGLLHWQLPNQFSKYLVELSHHDVDGYLEIGTRHGGTFVITVEYLNRFSPIRKAVGVDLGRSRSLRRYAAQRDGVKVVRADTHGDRFRAFLRKEGPFDLVLIDGDHSEEGCRSDFELVKDESRLIAFHDIASDDVPGVEKVWREVKETYGGSFRFLEFAEPHPDKTETTSDFGLGLAVRRR